MRLPADAVRELRQMADGLDVQARSWGQEHSNPYLKRWLLGVRRGLTDAAESCRRRARRIELAREGVRR